MIIPMCIAYQGGSGALEEPGNISNTLDDCLGNLDWSNTNRKGQTALDHVQKHSTPNYQREMHGVLRGDTHNN